MKKIMITLAVCAAFAASAAANVTGYGFYEDINYTSIIYGDHVYAGYTEEDRGLIAADHGLIVAHNSNARGFVGLSSYWPPSQPKNDAYYPTMFISTDLLPQQGVTLTGKVSIEMMDDLYTQASGTAYGILLGSFKPARYPDGTPMFLNMSVTPNGLTTDYENFYFKLYNDGGLLTELNAGKMVDTVYVTAGDRLNFEMYALMDDQVANYSITRRDFQFTTIQGSSVSVVPLPGSMLLGGIGTSIISIFGRANRRRLIA